MDDALQPLDTQDISLSGLFDTDGQMEDDARAALEGMALEVEGNINRNFFTVANQNQTFTTGYLYTWHSTPHGGGYSTTITTTTTLTTTTFTEETSAITSEG